MNAPQGSLVAPWMGQPHPRVLRSVMNTHGHMRENRNNESVIISDSVLHSTFVLLDDQFDQFDFSLA